MERKERQNSFCNRRKLKKNIKGLKKKNFNVRKSKRKICCSRKTLLAKILFKYTPHVNPIDRRKKYGQGHSGSECT